MEKWFWTVLLAFLDCVGPWNSGTRISNKRTVKPANVGTSIKQ